MIGNLLDGISNKIFEAFGEECTIYLEKQEQGFKDNSFFIKVIDTKYTPMYCGSMETEVLIEVLYFTSSADSQQKTTCYKVFDKLSKALEEIALEDCIVFGQDIGAKVIDDVLVCTARFGYFISGEYTDKDLEEIEDLELNL